VTPFRTSVLLLLSVSGGRPHCSMSAASAVGAAVFSVAAIMVVSGGGGCSGNGHEKTKGGLLVSVGAELWPNRRWDRRDI
jgi:hypothetical protein